MGSITQSKLIFGILVVVMFGFAQIQAQTYEAIIYYPTDGFNDVTVAGNEGSQRVGQARLTGQPYPKDGHALLWLGSSTTPIDLHPATGGWLFSEAFDTDGIRQVGYIKKFNGQYIIQNSVIWNSSANDFVTLYEGFSAAVAIGGDQQVGWISGGLSCSECGPTNFNYAVLWRGSRESMVILNPPGQNWRDAGVADTDGVQQVGSGTDANQPADFQKRALIWYGSRESFVDITPDGYRHVFAVAVKNGTQVGRAVLPAESRYRAVVWHNTKESFRDLGYGYLFDTNGTAHVGFASGANGNTHAFRWDGDGGARVDLHDFLPPGVFTYSYATGINVNGDISGWGQTADYRSIGFLLRRTDVTNNAPNILLTSPVGNQTYTMGRMMNLAAEATDSDGTIASVEFYADGTRIGTASTAGKNLFQMNWFPEQAGTYRLQAKAIDNSGAVSVSRPVLIRVVRRNSAPLGKN